MDNKAIQFLYKSKDQLFGKLTLILRKHQFRYETFGKEIEDYFIEEIISLLKNGGFIKNENDFKKAKDKNEFPDLTLLFKPVIAIEIKSGNHFKKINGGWSSCKNSENDMGTINKWPEKIKKFGGENIYYIFIEYIITDRKKEIVDLKIDRFYKFLGLNREGFLKYREKDGNLRPKDFNAQSQITSLEKFLDLLQKTKVYRGKRIINKHMSGLPEEERTKLIAEFNKTPNRDD